MSYWRHAMRGFLFLLVPFIGAFLVSVFTPWDIVDTKVFDVVFLYGVPLFGAFWLGLYIRKMLKNPPA
ncbi:MAG: hypothetical protein JSR60_07470 [Proteobacteria bacterium]|nr:hypothetical protein [Pseudomonadota bacterium]